MQENIADLLDRWPHVIPVFMRHRMSCVGCAMAPYESLGDALAIYGLDADRFAEEIRQTLLQQPKGNR